MELKSDIRKEVLTLDMVNLALKKALSRNDFVVKTFELQSPGDGLLGFLGLHAKIKVVYILNGEENTMQLFMKTVAKVNDGRMEFSNRFKTNEREVFVYDEIFSQLKEEEDSKTWHPKCYLIQGQDFIFEDLHSRGFKMSDLRQNKDDKHIRVTMQAIARLHAASLLLIDRKTKINKQPFDLYKAYGKQIGKGFFGENSWYDNTAAHVLTLAGESKLYGKDTKHYNKIKDSLEQLFTKARNLLKPSAEHRNVLIHLDLWNNNMMYKYDETGEPTQCIIVDYQVVQICPPAIDVVSFLYLNVDKAPRDKDFNKYIRMYYDEVAAILLANHLEVECIMSWDSFKKSCEESRLWGAVNGTFDFQFIHITEDEVGDMMNDEEAFNKLMFGDRRDMLLKKLKTDDIFANRIMDCIHELIEIYIIK